MDEAQKQLDELITLRDRMTKDMVSQADFVVVFNKLLEDVKDIIKELVEKGNVDKQEIKDKLGEVSTYIGQVEARLLRLNNQNKLDFKEELNVLTQQIYKEVNSIKELIPEAKDYSYLETRISDVEGKIPQIPEFKLDEGEQTVDKINALPLEEDKMIDISHIRGVEKLQKELEDVKRRPSGGSIVGRDIIRPIDISSQLDGIKTTFNIQAIYYPISVSLSSYPYASLRAGIDYTWTPTTITFTSEIDAETQLSSGQKCIILAVL